MLSASYALGGVEALAYLGGTAFVAALLAQGVGLPPLLGFIGAGFLLNGLGVILSTESAAVLTVLSELGVLLLLFTVGLKLDLATICRREVIYTTVFETVVMALIGAGALELMRWTGLEMVQHLELRQQLLIGITLSFSSTILAIKILQERGEVDANYGRLAMAILVAQDIIAVAFLALVSGHVPSPACIPMLIFLPFLRPLIYHLIDWLGHNEMFILGGVVISLCPGIFIFKRVGLEPELGALLSGMLVAGHPRASELSKVLFGLKELCLITYFLQLGLFSTPTYAQCLVALCFLLLLPLKGLCFYLPTKLFHFRARTVFSVTTTLSNFSEFGIILAKHAATAEGSAIDPGWSTVFALATALSMPTVGPLSLFLRKILAPFHRGIESNLVLHPEDRLIDFGRAQILILGMGRIGRGAYDEFRSRYGEVILGVELNHNTVNRHAYAGRKVITADATDPDFWARIMPGYEIQLVLLAMSHSQSNQTALVQLQSHHYQGRIAAIVEYEDEENLMRELGVDAAFNIYSEAGSGFAAHLVETLNMDQFLAPSSASTIPASPSAELEFLDEALG